MPQVIKTDIFHKKLELLLTSKVVKFPMNM